MTDFEATRRQFDLPDGMIYMDGNSLGPLPSAVPGRLQSVAQDEWRALLITAWNKAGWMEAPRRLGDRVGQLIGAPDGSVVLGDTLSVKVHQALAAALALRPDRKVILSDTGNFPSDLYMAEGLIGALGQGHELRLVAPEDVADALDETTACLMLTEIDYRTGRKHDMQRLTQAAHEVGALTLWDLAHSAGAFPVDLAKAQADFAVGCTYKYLNAGPGAPAFIYVRPDLIEAVAPQLSGWLGHKAPFDFEQTYRPGAGIDRMRIGTPPVLQLAALEVALEVWKAVSLEDVRQQSIRLSERFIAEVEANSSELVLASPRDPDARGSQVSFRHPDGYAVMQALIARGVIGDFRAPDIIRFGITPLYLSEDDVVRAAGVLCNILQSREWDDPAFKTRAAVT